MIKRCKSCGCSATLKTNKEGGRLFCFVSCDSCGERGVKTLSPEHSISAWNIKIVNDSNP